MVEYAVVRQTRGKEQQRRVVDGLIADGWRPTLVPVPDGAQCVRSMVAVRVGGVDMPTAIMLEREVENDG